MDIDSFGDHWVLYERYVKFALIWVLELPPPKRLKKNRAKKVKRYLDFGGDSWAPAPNAIGIIVLMTSFRGRTNK